MLAFLMAGRINNPNPNLGFWPWPGNVREKLVERSQLAERKKANKKKGDPNNPPLASAALLEFMGPGRSSEELRFPSPVSPRVGEARTSEDSGLEALGGLLDRAGESNNANLARDLGRLNVAPDRLERLKSLLQREAGMLQVMGRLQTDMAEIHRRIRDENKAKGY
jgi:hypothetical protein